MNLKLPKGTAKIGDYLVYKESNNRIYTLEVRGYQYCPTDCGWRYLTNDFSPTIDNEHIINIIKK